MGMSQCWAAVEGAGADEVCRALGLRRTGAYEDFDEGPMSGFMTGSGWYVVTDMSFTLLEEPAVAARLSSIGRCVWGGVVETTMYAAATAYENGQEIWAVTYEGEGGPRIEALEARGALPSSYASIKNEMTVEQAGDPEVDYIFEIPVRLAWALTGYRHDEGVVSESDTPYETLLERS